MQNPSTVAMSPCTTPAQGGPYYWPCSSPTPAEMVGFDTAGIGKSNGLERLRMHLSNIKNITRRLWTLGFRCNAP